MFKNLFCACSVHLLYVTHFRACCPYLHICNFRLYMYQTFCVYIYKTFCAYICTKYYTPALSTYICVYICTILSMPVYSLCALHQNIYPHPCLYVQNFLRLWPRSLHIRTKLYTLCLYVYNFLRLCMYQTFCAYIPTPSPCIKI